VSQARSPFLSEARAELMKTSLAIYGAIASLMSAPALAAPSLVPIQPQSQSQPLVQLEEPDEKLIKGIVKDRTDNRLVITDALDETRETRITLTSRTKYFKDDREARAEDITVGARVHVKIGLESDEKLEALEVTVIKSQVVECQLDRAS
jgi:hypothetical protein